MQSKAWIDGFTKHNTSNIVDNARNDQHKEAMMRLRREQARKTQEPMTAYSNIARRITELDNATKKRIKEILISVSFLQRKSLSLLNIHPSTS